MFVKPWNKEAEMIFRQLSQNGKAYTRDTRMLPVQFGIHCKEIIGGNLLDISTTRNKREKRTWFVTLPGIKVIPKNGKRGVSFQFTRL